MITFRIIANSDIYFRKEKNYEIPQHKKLNILK